MHVPALAKNVCDTKADARSVCSSWPCSTISNDFYFDHELTEQLQNAEWLTD